MLLDLHVHTKLTPGCNLDPALSLEKAEALGLDGICFTDRNTWKAAAIARELRPNTDLAVLAGAEIVTDHGHYLCFVPDPERTPEPEELFGPLAGEERWPARRVVEKIGAVGGVVVAAHPYDRHVEKPSGDFVLTLRGLAAIEGICGTRRSNVNELAIEAADHLGLPCIGGSAAFDTYDQIGTAATLLRDAIRSEAELVAALRDGAVWAVQIGTPPRFFGDEEAVRERREEPREERRDERRRGRGRHRGRR